VRHLSLPQKNQKQKNFNWDINNQLPQEALHNDKTVFFLSVSFSFFVFKA